MVPCRAVRVAVALVAAMAPIGSSARAAAAPKTPYGRGVAAPHGGAMVAHAEEESGAGPAADHGEYLVHKGETLSAIAVQLQTSVQTLIAVNSIANPNRIRAGTTLRLPGPIEAPAGPAAPSSHTVAPGETLSEIAKRYGVTVASLASANGIVDRDRIVAGTSLVVPSVWRCPVVGMLRFSDDFGVEKPDGRFHEGTDVYAARGTPVVAPVGGEVVQLNGKRGGLQFVLDGDDGHRYIGTHLDTPGSSGRVAAGASLGTVGDTGNARGSSPHLHFEIHPNGGVAANPYPVLTASCPR